LLYHPKASQAERSGKKDYGAWVNIPFTKEDVESVSLNHSPPAEKMIGAVASTGNVWKRVSFLCG